MASTLFTFWTHNMSIITEYIKVESVAAGEGYIVSNRLGNRVHTYKRGEAPARIEFLMEGHAIRYFMADYSTEHKAYNWIRPTRLQDW